MASAEQVEALITRSPGLTGGELATALFGNAGCLAQVTTVCLRLIKDGRIDRSGRGGRSDPFRYFPKGVLTTPTRPAKHRRYYPF
jgi:hypothetical protein